MKISRDKVSLTNDWVENKGLCLQRNKWISYEKLETINGFILSENTKWLCVDKL